ncbi:MAG: hypothetical protein FWG60_02370 [Methanomassiliicoccaceae archaeon]|nr:hypothetical protein [Methanomassiliicoccaceae archaeon]
MNKKGMIGFPMRLAVTFLILAIFVPVAFSMVDGLEKDSAASAAKAEAEKIAGAAKRTYYSGAGSTETISISLSGGSCLVIGGEGSESYSISILLGDNVVEKMYLQRPSVRFLGDPLYLMGNRVITAECVIDDGTYGVKVVILD